jgi:hypothetical protein
VRGEVVSQASGDEVKVFKNGDKRGQYLGEITLFVRLKRYRTTKTKQQQKLNRQKKRTQN